MKHYLPETLKPLVGKTLSAIDREAIDSVIITFGDGHRVRLSVEGDCCSTSIFYEIDADAALGGALMDIDESGWMEDSLSVTTADSEDVALAKIAAAGLDFYPEENSVWNVVLVTDKGNALIRHINSSNGYYDGTTNYEALPSLESDS